MVQTNKPDFEYEEDIYGAPIFKDKENPNNLKKAAQANLDRFGHNPDKFTNIYINEGTEGTKIKRRVPSQK